MTDVLNDMYKYVLIMWKGNPDEEREVIVGSRIPHIGEEIYFQGQKYVVNKVSWKIEQESDLDPALNTIVPINFALAEVEVITL